MSIKNLIESNQYTLDTLKIDNTWIAASVADSISANIFTEVSALKKEISFNTSFLPHLDMLDKVSITYDSGEFEFGSLWDINSWGDSSSVVGDNGLVWSASLGDTIDFVDKELGKELSQNNIYKFIHLL